MNGNTFNGHERNGGSSRRRRKNNIPTAYLIIGAALLLAVVVLASFLIATNSALSRSRREHEDYESAAAEREAALNAERAALAETLAASRSALKEAEESNAQLRNEVQKLEEEQAELIRTFEDTDERYHALSKKIAALNEQIAKNEADMQKMREDIAMLERTYSVDLNAQMQLMNHLNDLLEHPITFEVEQPLLDEEGEPILGEDGEPITETVMFEPHIAVYYEDIMNGYTYSFQADDVFDSASLIKAPFSLAHLMAASEEAAQQEAARLAAEEAGEPYEPPHHTDEEGNEVSDLIYDFDREFVYFSEESFRTGSGRIAQGEDGAVYTYGELFYYLLRYSDNVAYHTLKEAYGIETFRLLVLRQGWRSMWTSLSNMSARDAGKIMMEIYRFTESEAAYAPLMKEAMTGSAHSVIIPYAVSGRLTAHKYGWDKGAYHDMAIVYDEHPYVISVMSNYENGGDEVNAYLREIVSTIDSIHQNFYVNR